MSAAFPKCAEPDCSDASPCRECSYAAVGVFAIALGRHPPPKCMHAMERKTLQWGLELFEAKAREPD